MEQVHYLWNHWCWCMIKTSQQLSTESHSGNCLQLLPIDGINLWLNGLPTCVHVLVCHDGEFIPVFYPWKAQRLFNKCPFYEINFHVFGRKQNSAQILCFWASWVALTIFRNWKLKKFLSDTLWSWKLELLILLGDYKVKTKANPFYVCMCVLWIFYIEIQFPMIILYNTVICRQYHIQQAGWPHAWW